MTDRCPVCDDLVRGGVLCKQHRKELADALHELRLGIYELSKLARREIHLDGGSLGRSHPVEAPTPLDLGAQDLLDNVTDVLSQAAATVNKYGDKPQQLVRICLGRVGELASASDCKRTYREIRTICEKVKRRITPSGDMIIYGPCLSDACRRPVMAPRGTKEAQCEYCGSIWSVRELRDARRARYRIDPTDSQGRDHTLTLTPAQAAAWIRRETNLPIKRFNVSNWLTRGQLPSSAKTSAKGTWTFNPIELLDCAQGTYGNGIWLS